MRACIGFILCLFLSAGCTRPERASLALRLERAESRLAYWSAEVEAIQVKIHAQRIREIAARVDLFEAELMALEPQAEALQQLVESRLPGLFAQEREDLGHLINSCNGHEADAQVVLDRILRVITHVSQLKAR